VSEIVLATLTARYIHASLGLRYLLANLGDDLSPRATLQEFTIQEPAELIADRLLALNPTVIGLGVYIWNATQTGALVKVLKRRRPEVCVVLGGPEVSHETEMQDVVADADYVICGEGEVDFPALCRSILGGQRPVSKILQGRPPETKTLHLPYGLYDDKDIKTRVLYVEASRGCPFRCEFCLSSLDKSVRDIPLERFLPEMERLLERGATQLKFIDRTFNLKPQTCRAILQFFLERLRPGLFLHFELVPDRLPQEVRELVTRFPPGSLQFEVGIQTFNDEVSKRISRRQNVPQLEDNLRFLRRETHVHVHADLIVGLPGETLESFGQGFDRLLQLRPQEIQVGILKRLRGTPISRHTEEWRMAYSPTPPYEVLESRTLDADTVRRLKHFSKFWDLFGNSGNFRDSVALLIEMGSSPFDAFLRFSDWLYARTGRDHSLSLDERVEHLLAYFQEQGRSPELVGPLLLADYLRPARRRIPLCLKPFASADQGHEKRVEGVPARQARHLSGSSRS
jgi:radical SAM superfamily enzyme YgiQ (UPF0313 family)